MDAVVTQFGDGFADIGQGHAVGKVSVGKPPGIHIGLSASERLPNQRRVAVAVADHLGVHRAVWGGLSLGGMVAMLLSLILGIAIVTVFVNNSHSFNQDDNVLRMQDDARYALQQVAFDLSMAGHYAELLSPAGVTPDTNLTVGLDCGPAGVTNWAFRTTRQATGESLSVIAIDNVLIDHYGKTIEDVGAAKKVLESWAKAEWFTRRPELPEEIKVKVFKVEGEINTDDFSPAGDAWNDSWVNIKAHSFFGSPGWQPFATGIPSLL